MGILVLNIAYYYCLEPKLLNMPPTGHVDIAPPDYSIYQQELRAVFGEYLTAIQCFRECKVLSYAYRDYIMFRVVLEAVCHLGIPPNRHGQSFRIGSFNLKNGSVKGVTIAQFVDDLGLSWGTWSSKSSLFFNIEDLLQICSKSQDEGCVMVYDVRKLQGDLQVWSDASLPLLDEPSVKRVQSSRKLQEKLKHILVRVLLYILLFRN